MTAYQQVATKLFLYILLVPITMSNSWSSTGSNQDTASYLDSKADNADKCIDDSKPAVSSCSSAEDSLCTDDGPVASSSNAVVLYRPTALHAFRQETKKYSFVKTELVIKQKWEDIGVAAVVWDAAVVLAEYLEKNSEEFSLQGKRVVELGAGTGLVSMVAALLGAKVIATDRKLALQFLQENIQDNFPCIKDENGLCEQDDKRISVKELDWGQNHKQFHPIFDYIVGADIVYIEETFEHLLETMLHLTSSSRKSRILLSCRIRYERDERFLKMMRSHFVVKEIHHDDKRDIKIYVGDRER
ncbi:protein N-lysine methyltransferase METTL21A-like [Amphiura filiformis]|uniref:protein N-lysine methyltransferase METTL21A-like n=1 Tax=Amphiura filiformis TaxID=82378 RepID=UPI003B212732